MHVVVASRSDQTAQALAGRWAAHHGCDVALLTCAGLSVAGWSHRVGAPDQTIAVLEGRQLRSIAIDGVLTRLAYVTPDELPHIAASDRAYVAQEMTAFLLSWLSSLACPVLNPPWPDCLAGPGWTQERWLLLAGQLGIPVQPLTRQAVWADEPPSAPSALPALPARASVAGGGCFGAVDPALADHALRLASASGARMLNVYFSSPGADARLVGVDLWPDVSSPEIGDAALAYLRQDVPC